MIPSKSDNTCLICTHAIDNHGTSIYDKLNQYYCQLCSCKFSFVPGAAYITVVNDPIDSTGDGIKVKIKDELEEEFVDWTVKLGPNLSSNAPTITNDKGGKQSQLSYRFDLLDTKAMFQLASILHQGAIKYGDNNWRNIPAQDHINHALVHIFAYLHHDTQDDHLGHAFCRLMFALDTEHDSTSSRE